ncbi:hypothetical protein WHR41_02737 [Cladosporium halotolerans]|uniref:Uncharacterized protein n=1 Tax=Cladosporium halotolerans TaxID=1052096 RepID=A0AB34KUC7_9PEZI
MAQIHRKIFTLNKTAVEIGEEHNCTASAARRLLKAPSTENVRFTEKVGVYGGNEMLGPDGFDVVYMAIGTLGREKDLLLWAKTVAKLLRPGGSLFLREKHPIVDAVDENHRNRVMITKPYFRNLGRIAAVSAEDNSFTETEACPERQYSVEQMAEVENDAEEWVFKHGRNRLPLSYTLHAMKV